MPAPVVRAVRACVALVLAALSLHAFGWGEEGHRLVGRIADQHLTWQAAREVAFLLRNDRLAGGGRSGRTTLGEVAYWADEIRDHRWGKARSRWHYDDIPVCGTPDYAKICRRGNCASEQLARHLAKLKDRRVPLRERNEALKWVVHLVGDIHQPLHAANNQDHGGNAIEVSFFGIRDNAPYGTMRLHAVWDIFILRRLLAATGGEDAFLSRPISGSDKYYWERGSVQKWIDESHRLAVRVAYGTLPGGLQCGRRPPGVVEIDAAYHERAAPVVETQIRKAGIRLARLLNDVFSR